MGVVVAHLLLRRVRNCGDRHMSAPWVYILESRAGEEPFVFIRTELGTGPLADAMNKVGESWASDPATTAEWLQGTRRLLNGHLRSGWFVTTTIEGGERIQFRHRFDTPGSGDLPQEFRWVDPHPECALVNPEGAA